EFTALDHLFHQALFQAAHVVPLWHVISARAGHIDRLRRLNLPDPGKMSDVLDSHERILAAIRASDSAAPEAETRKHLSGTLSSLATITGKYPEYFTTSPTVWPSSSAPTRP